MIARELSSQKFIGQVANLPQFIRQCGDEDVQYLRQICSLCTSKTVQIFTGECSKLVEWSKVRDGQHHILTDTIGGDEKVIAVLTILPAKLVALQQHFELIEIDGTHPELSL
jgi:hypothetical protein